MNANRIESLRLSIKGRVFTPRDGEFDALVTDVWNLYGTGPRRPGLVVRAAVEDDVVQAVRFAKAEGLKVAVRGGGHNWANPSIRQGCMLIDLSDLTGIVSVDAANRRAVVRPIVSNREIQAALNPLGLSYPSGHCPQVKMSGYLLSGGMSWNHGVWGPGVGSVEAIELVTADGELILADKDHHPGYFWAARGAGPGFFGVCLRYHLKLYPLPKAITCGSWLYPLGKAPEVGEWLESLAPKLPPSVELTLFLLKAPDEVAGKLPPGDGGMACLVTATVFAGTPEEAHAALAPLDDGPHKAACLKGVTDAPCDFESLFDASGALWPEGLRNQVDAMFSNAPLAGMVRSVERHVAASPSPLALVLFSIYTGPDGAPKLPDAAFSMTAKYYGGPWTMWETPGQDQAMTAWHEQCVDKLRPHISGRYVSESSTTAHPEYVREAYTEESWNRLERLRAKYDPTGVFYNHFEALG